MPRKNPVAIPNEMKNDSSMRKTLDEDECLSVIQTVINSLASRGNTVIVGRGGQAILKDKVNVLHVRIIAPVTIRAERIMKSEGLTQEEAVRYG